MAIPSKISTGLSGVAGEYFVAGELTRRGFIASITLRNTRGIDVLVAGKDATCSAGIQVKTNQGVAKSWMLTKKAETLESDGLFYAFVNLNGSDNQPTYHIVPSAVVAESCRTSHRNWLATPGRGGRPHKDNSIRIFADADDLWRDRWDVLGLDRMS